MTVSTQTGTDTYRFRLDFNDEERAPVHSEPIPEAEFQRAIAEACFAGFRQGLFPTYDPQWDQALIEPRFADEADSARTEGFRVHLPRPEGETYSHDFPIGYFSARASRMRAGIVRDRNWPTDRPLYFTLGAYLDDGVRQVASNSLVLESASLAVPIRGGSLGGYGIREAWDNPQPTEMPVVVSRSLLEEACEEANRYPDREIGGLILGDLHCDAANGQVFLRLKCLASGEGTTESSKASVTFTADSFAKARRLIALRASQGMPPEIIAGWMHSHPFKFCAECPLPTPPECVKKVLFYSDDDVQLMESTFYQPFMVGLLAGVEPKLEGALGHLPVRLFGWSNGEVKPRGFEVVDD